MHLFFLHIWEVSAELRLQLNLTSESIARSDELLTMCRAANNVSRMHLEDYTHTRQYCAMRDSTRQDLGSMEIDEKSMR